MKKIKPIFKNKKGLEMSFKVLFAIIIGAFILFLAIYASTRLIPSQSSGTNAALAKEIGVLLNPLETGFETGKTSLISTSVETRIYNDCNNYGNFGNQLIQVSQKTFSKWSEPSLAIEFPNKYIFSDIYEEGKEFNVFSKPLNLPFKIADLVLLSSTDKNYCFVDAPLTIREELEDLNQSNLKLGNCDSNSTNQIRVCFSQSSNCDVNVRYSQGWVEKNNSRVYFAGDTLMYAAVFSNKSLYECQVQRIAMRAKELSTIYQKKQSLVAGVGCSTNLDLASLTSFFESYEKSSDIQNIYYLANSIGSSNDISSCRLW